MRSNFNMPTSAIRAVILGDRYTNAVARFKAELTAFAIPAFDLAYFMAGTPDSQRSLTPIIGPESFKMLPVGRAMFVSGRGWTGDGSTGYLDTGWFPSTHGVNFLQDSACLCAYNLTDRTATLSGALLGTNISGLTRQNYIVPLNASGAFGTVNTNNSINYAASPNAKGFWHVNRSASNAMQLYRNGSSVGTSGAASVARSTSSLLVLANRQGTGGIPADFSTDLCAAVLVGASLDATQSANLSIAVNNYMKTFGLNVY
jgi:hypothetical protein